MAYPLMLDRKVTTSDNVEGMVLGASGNGNCLYNSTALAIINLIHQGKLSLNAEQVYELLQALRDPDAKAAIDRRIIQLGDTNEAKESLEQFKGT